MINDHRQCLYNGGVETGKIFEPGDKIPKGWFDRPDASEWDNPPIQISTPDGDSIGETEPERPPAKNEPRVQKYPSQMNKAELIEFGSNLGLELEESMSKRDMREAINESIKRDA